MDFLMKGQFFKILFFVFPIWYGIGENFLFAQKQEFEADFQPLNYPLEFLPNWYGNEISTGTARIFQISGQGRGGSKALAVQPISTFEGKIWVRMNPKQFQSPRVVFYARSIQNGSGNRPALVFYSWGTSLNGDFTSSEQIGNNSEFSNKNQEFRKFSLSIPEELKSEPEVFLVLDIRYGPGTGSAARWIMDDFEMGDFIQDTIPPLVEGVKGFAENALLVRFSEIIDPVFSSFPIAFELDGQNPDRAEMRQDSLLVLTFMDKLEQMRTYSLAVRQIPDLEGNFLRDTLVSFTFSDPTSIGMKDLVINELMPAPKADQDLPNVEFVELYHAGVKEIRMDGVRLSNSRTEVSLDEFWLQPDSFLILVPENQASQFQEFGNVLPVKNWPTLLNSGDQVTLTSSKGEKIDQVSFATSAWGGSEFANGGYSLEVSNPDFLCDNSSLLRASIAALRGTPGVQNSVFNQDSEILSPKLETAYFKDSLEIIIRFSGPVFPIFPSDYLSFSPSLEVDTVMFDTEKEIRIKLQSPAKFHEPYKLSISGLIDCLGIPMSDQQIELVLAEKPEMGDLIINEILFNPKAGEPKFVELKNTSHKYLRLENWAIANLTDSGIPDQTRVFGNKEMILRPEDYLAITTDRNALQLAYPKSSTGNIFQIPTLPSFPISGGTVALISSKGELAEIFLFNEELHHPLLRDPKGVSLERISSFSPAANKLNWQSAAGSEGFATPGRRNSQAYSSGFDSEIVQIEPEIFDPEGSLGLTYTTITYRLDRTDWVGTFKIYSSSGQLIQTLVQNQILGTNGLLTWDGTDTSGKLARAGYYIIVVELYELGGETKLFKKTVVVATRL